MQAYAHSGLVAGKGETRKLNRVQGFEKNEKAVHHNAVMLRKKQSAKGVI